MADVKMPRSIPCKFDKNGWAPCGKPSTNGWCSKHETLKCKSCGKKAVRRCGAQMGGLLCGVSLCDNCQHSLEGGEHVGKLVFGIQVRDRDELLKTGKESSRLLALRGIPTHVPLPSNLQECLKQKWSGSFLPKICYFLRIKTNMMGAYPAIVKDTEIVVVTADKEIICKVWRSLEPRDSELVSGAWMVNEGIGVGYHICSGEFEKTQSRPYKLFGKEEIEKYLANDPKSFRWAPGLFGADIGEAQFHEMIAREEFAFK